MDGLKTVCGVILSIVLLCTAQGAKSEWYYRVVAQDDTAAGKIEALTNCGVIVAPTPDRIGEAIVEAIRRAGIYEKCLIQA